ncbi:MAG: hypothetical protein H0V40_09905 [Actinobacteria bacterium]|nr:hypothetical protein [Actinomycetota bacterium]
MNRRTLSIGAPGVLLTLAALAAGCGGASKSTASQTRTPQPAGAAGGYGTTTGSGSQNSGALTVEAQQTAAGDIPDNQVFLTFSNSAAGYSMKYPEGWAQRGRGSRVAFQDKNNLVRITIVKGTNVNATAVTADMHRLEQQTPSLRFDAPVQLTVSGRAVVKVVYSTESAPNPVTGKRVTLVVDRYYVAGAGKHAVVELGTPQGVDNVDAYELMLESFQWT